MIAVSIVSYNTSSLLKKTLENLYSQKNIEHLEVWVVDNNSSDDSVSMVKRYFPKVHLIESKHNLGFSRGQNLILKKTAAESVLILNPDVELEKNSLSKMMEFTKKNPDLSIISCKILDSSGKLTSNGGDLPFGSSLIAWLFNLDFKGLKNFHRSDKMFYDRKNAGWVGGTFMLVKKEVFEKIGFFDEDYFMYFEDVDLCFRAGKVGFKIGFNPDLEIVHFGGASSKNPKYSQWLGEMRGLIKFSYKNSGLLNGLLVSGLVRAAIMLRIISFAIVGKLDYSEIYLKVLTNL